MKKIFVDKTRTLRYNIVKLIAPSVYPLTFNQRPVDFYLQLHYPEPLIGVEVGVWRGEHAKEMLSLLKIKQLYLVDPYLPFIENDKVYSEELTKANLESAQQRLLQFNGKAKFITVPSIEATALVPDNLDFVYIDANHTYAAVKSDVAAWFPKVRCGGVVGGHDFQPVFQSVVRAVVEFASSMKAKLYFQGSDWWIIKGEVNEGIFS